MSSAAMVSLRMRLSAKATSSGMRRVEVMAHHQHVEMLVERVHREGPRRIGRGRQHVRQARDLDDVGRMAAAGALGVEGVDGAALERGDGVLDEARLRSACRCGSSPARRSPSATPRQQSIARRRGAPVLVQLQRAGAGLDHLLQRLRRARRCPCRRSRDSSGRPSAAWIMRPRCHGPGVQVVATVPCAGPVPPPSIVVMPDISASSICCGQMKWMWVSMPPAVRILPSPAITSVPGPIDDVDARLDVGIAGLADRGDAAVLDADIGLDDAPVVDDQRVGDDGVDRALLG